jgi:translocation and assembly module TamA
VFTFFRVMPEVRGYISFGEEKKVTLAAKLKVGTLHSFNIDGESPIMARFFSGGSAMRGFATRRLSPLLETPASDVGPPLEFPPANQQVVPGETVPIGGKGLVEASVELRWNVWGNLVLAIFSDTGMVTWESLAESANQLQYLYTSVGIGARYRTPLGPVRLDFAVRLPVGSPQRLNPGGKLDPRIIVYEQGGCFGFGNTDPNWGGHAEGICGFHLSIGEAF